jgi:cellulose synthase (UDP-forming)
MESVNSPVFNVASSGILTVEEPRTGADAAELCGEVSCEVDVMSADQKRQFQWFIGLWIMAFTGFWWWWFDPAHLAGTWRFAINTAVLGWSVTIPAYFFFFLGRMKKPNPALSLPANAAVAMVVTKAPSEPWALVQQTLEAALAQDHPHDTWLADEDPSQETITWCREHGVHTSSRKGIPDYHRLTWPRKTRCKEGNLSYFYDHYGYENYDLVVQMDADHRPGTNYLKEMIRPFANPRVGYVSAPSICDANAQRSWAVRGRLFAEATTHGPLQAGYSAGFAPLCIGSHYAVRTCALREIGGLGPELAEDHSTTLLMNAAGWKGVHAFEADARGEGPSTFNDLVTQEFQWSKSLTKILLTLTPRHFGGLNFRLKFQFLFSQVWYVLLGLTMLVGTLMPPLAVMTNRP